MGLFRPVTGLHYLLLGSGSKELPGSIPKMEEKVGPVSTCGREIIRIHYSRDPSKWI
jgi:hypothetical protein